MRWSVRSLRCLRRLGGPRGRAVLAAAGAILLVTGAIGASPSAAAALRAAGVLTVLVAAAGWVRRRAALRLAPSALTIEARQALAREVGLALVAVNGQRLLLGYGPSGVALLVTLPSSPEGEP